MSRTKRRKSGNRWFAEKRSTWVPLDGVKRYVRYYWWGLNSVEHVLCQAYRYTRAEYDKELIALYESDRAHAFSYASDVKTFDNSVRRARQRQQLSKIMKGQDYYDFTYEDSKCKGAAWLFD